MSATSASEQRSQRPGGHLYMQTNEVQNAVVHYRRAPDGTITEVERVRTGGSGVGPDGPFFVTQGAKGILLTPDGRLLMAVNPGDNSVSSFAVGSDGKLTLVDRQETGNMVTGKSGTAKSLAYSARSHTLYVLHSFGPDHLRLMSVDREGRLTARPERYSVVPKDKPKRLSTMAVLSPDEKFLLVAASLDELPAANPDGTPILWVTRSGKPHSIFANAPDPDGLAVFPVNEDGTLGDPVFQDAGGGSPWFPLFLNHRPDKFLLGFSTADGVSLSTFDPRGHVSTGPVVRADTRRGRPTSLCWMAMTPDDKFVFTTMTSYGYITSWRIDGDAVSVAKDPASPEVAGDGTYRGLAGDISSRPNDIWITPDGAYVYQLYPNASRLVGYAVQPDGALDEITSANIPHNSSQGLTGF
jgi:Lactonase, 7-bladed beta-propeller